MSDRFWLLVADASRAQVYAGKSPIAKLREVRSFDHPKGRANEQDIVTDRPGRRSDEGSAHHSAMETDVKGREERVFAREIGEFIGSAHDDQQFTHLSIVAPPSMLGNLREQLPSRVQSKILEEVAKAVTDQSIEQITEHLTRLHPE